MKNDQTRARTLELKLTLIAVPSIPSNWQWMASTTVKVVKDWGAGCGRSLDESWCSVDMDK